MLTELLAKKDKVLITNDKHLLKNHSSLHHVIYYSPKQLKDYLNQFGG